MNSYTKFQSIVSQTIFLVRWRVRKDASEVTVERKHIFYVLLSISSHLSSLFLVTAVLSVLCSDRFRVCSAQEPWMGDLGPWLLSVKAKRSKTLGEAGTVLHSHSWTDRKGDANFFLNIICGISQTKDETQIKKYSSLKGFLHELGMLFRLENR